MSETLFIIKNETGIISLFDNLEKAKNELKNIYKKTIDFKHYGYEINGYILINDEYVFHSTYTYYFDKFVEKEK